MDRYILKIYRHFHTEFAKNSIEILKYLASQDFPTARIVAAADGSFYTEIETPVGNSVAVLYEYIDGEEPADTDLSDIATQTGTFHNLMDGYIGVIARRGREHFIERYINLLSAIDFPKSELLDIENYGRALWRRFSLSSQGFCHGDYHCGNMLKKDSRFWFFDFDSACYSHPIIDIAVICDETNYFNAQGIDFDRTTQKLEHFLRNYEKTRHGKFGDIDIKSVYDFIAIRHYDIQATITDCQGYTMENLLNQHRWLMTWQNICEQKME